MAELDSNGKKTKKKRSIIGVINEKGKLVESHLNKSTAEYNEEQKGKN